MNQSIPNNSHGLSWSIKAQTHPTTKNKSNLTNYWNFHKNKNGFTLIEVLIAIVILSIGLLGIGQMQLMGIQGNASARGFSEASALGQDKMEELINLPYTDTALNDTDGDGTGQDTTTGGGVVNGIDNDDEGVAVDGIANFGLDDIVSPDGSELQIGATNTQYTISWNIAVDSPAANAKHIKVLVQWSNKGRISTISMDRIKSNI